MAVTVDVALVAAGTVSGVASLTLVKNTSGADRAAVICVATTQKVVSIAYGAEGHALQWAKASSAYDSTVAVFVNPPATSTNVVMTWPVAAVGRVAISSYNGVSAVPVRQKKIEAPSGVNSGNSDCILPANMLSTSIGVDMVGGFDGKSYNATYMTCTGTELNKGGAGTAPSAIWAGSQYLQGTGSNNTFTWFFNTTFGSEINHAAVELKQTDSEIYPIPRITALGTFTAGAGGTLFPGQPAHLTNDILVMVVTTANQAIPSWPAGWTEFTNSPQGTGTAGAIGGVRISAAWKRCASASETAPQLNAGTMNYVGARIFGVRGCITTGNPFDVTVGGVQASATNSYTMPSATTTVPNCLIAYMGAFDQDNAAANQLVMGTVPSGLDSGWDKIVESFTTTGTGGGLGVMYGAKKAAGAAGTASVLIVALTGTAAYLTVAFKPVPSTVNQVIVIQSLTTGVPALATGAVTQGHVIDAQSLTAAAPTLVTGTVGQDYVIDTQSLTTGVPAFAPGTVTQLHTINVNALATAPPILVTGAVTGRHVAAVLSLTTAQPTLATGTVTQRHVVVVANLTTSAPVLAAGVVTQKQVIVAQNLTTTAPTFVTGAITQRHVIVAAALTSAAPTLAAGSVTQRSTIIAQSLTTAAPTLAAGTVTQRHVAAVSSLTTSVPALAAGTVTQLSTIVAQSLTTTSPVLASGSVTQRHVAAVTSLITTAPTLVSGAVTQSFPVVQQNLVTAAPTLASGAVTQRHVIATTNLTTTAPTLASGAVTQVHVVGTVSLTTAAPTLTTGAVGVLFTVLVNSLTTPAPVLVSGAVTQRHVAAVASLTTATPTLAAGAITQRHVIATTALATTAPTLATGAVTQNHVIATTSLLTAPPVLPNNIIVVTFYLRPASDISAGGWTDQGGFTTGLYAAVLDKSAANFIQSSTSPAVADIAVLKVDTPPLVTPQQPFVVAYEYGKQTNNATRIDITIRLMQGTTEIAAWTHTDVSSTLNVAQQTLTGGQFATITDFYALRFAHEAIAP